MSEQDLALVRKFYDGAMSGDVETAFGCLDPAVVFRAPTTLPWGGEHSGHQGFLALNGRIMELFEVELERVDLVDSDTFVIADALSKFTRRTSGHSVHMQIIELNRVRDGVISDVDIFYKDPSLLTQLVEPGSEAASP